MVTCGLTRVRFQGYKSYRHPNRSHAPARMESLPQLIGSSSAVRDIEQEIVCASRSDAKVLITGESGVGKEIVAQLIHQRSRRAHSPLVTMNCAGVPDSLLESELF